MTQVNIRSAIPGPRSAELLQRWRRCEPDVIGYQTR